MNLAQLVVGHDGGARAIHDADGWHTWDDMRAAAAATAAALRQLGVGRGERVAMSWPASAGFVSTYLGILAAGAVAVPLNPADPAAAMAAELATVSPVLAIGGGAGGASLASAADEAGHVPVMVDDAGQGAWADALADVAGAPALVPEEMHRGDLAVLLFTSGTAGEPKAAMLSHGNLLANLQQLQAVPTVAAQPGDVGLCTLPLFHVFGLNVALGLCLATGSPLVLTDRFAADEATRLVEELQVTVVVGAPAAFAHWLRHLPGTGTNGSGPPPMQSLRLVVAGGAPVPAELARRFEARFGLPLHQGYGLTEAAPGVSTTIGTDHPSPGSAGRAFPGVEVRLVDDSGADALDGDPGEIWVRGANVFAGYWDDAAATAAVCDAEGWLHTGDIGICGADGDLYVVDRRKDLIIVSGFNVFPAEVERVVAGVPGIADAVVLGRADPLAGEVVEAVVVASDPADPPGEQAVLAYCAARLPRYKCPASVRVVDRLPRTVGGEALRRQVRGGQRTGLPEHGPG